jgi:uncharacterized membrane protein
VLSESSNLFWLWILAGGFGAAAVFALTVVSIPLMLDRRTDTMVAIFTSVRTLFANALPLYLWALLIVVVIGASLLLWMLPLVITAPLIGHATWHAYRALLEQQADAT